MRPQQPHPLPEPQQVVSATRGIVLWLTVLQALTAGNAVAFLLLVLLGNTDTLILIGAVLQAAWALVLILVLQFAKRWLLGAGIWSTASTEPDHGIMARVARILSGWLIFLQWLPVLVLIALGYLLLTTAQLNPDPAFLEQLRATNPQLAALSPADLAAAYQGALLLTLVAVGLPSVIINFVLLGWIRTWMRGVTAAITGGKAPQERLVRLAATIGRWFTFVQGVLVFLIGLILLVPLAPGLMPGSTRVELLIWFLSLALWIALLQWSKTLLYGVTARAAGENRTTPPA